MNGNRASGLRKGYTGPSLHGDVGADQKGMIPKGDFRQASHTNEKNGVYMQDWYILKMFSSSKILVLYNTY